MDVFGGRREWLRGLLIAGVAGLFLGVLGPFGSYLNASRPSVIAYWFAALLAGELVFGLTVRPARRLARLRKWPVVAVAGGACILAAIPISALSHAAAVRLWPGPIGGIGIAAWYGQTLIVASLMTVGHELPRLRRNDATAEPAERIAVAPAGRTDKDGDFLTRLPSHLGRDLVALQMEDHYVRAHTTKGSTLILIPLRQALGELSGVPGLQVHRSWWVARRAIVDTVQDGRNLRLRLVNGLQAPVSRANVAAVRKEGLLF